MKHLLLIIIFSLNTTLAFAADIHAICYTSMGGTTSFVVQTEEKSVNAEIFNHNGGGYAPFWSHLVVPNDLSILSKKAELIKKLDKGFKTSWKNEQCNWAGENKFSCIGHTDKIIVNGLEVEPWSIYSAVITDSSFAGDYKYIEVSLGFYVSGEQLRYTMRYPIDDCRIGDKPLSIKK